VKTVYTVTLNPPNRREVEQLVGRPLSDEFDLGQALQRFSDDGHAEAARGDTLRQAMRSAWPQAPPP
jgi:hypothetical protein